MQGLKDAYTTKEIAQILQMDAHTSVLRRAKSESWQSRPRAGRGGGNCWLVSSMPETTRHALALAVTARIAQAEGKKLPPITPELFTVNTLANVPERGRERAGARALLVNMARNFLAVSGSPRTTAYEVFCHEYNRGAIEAPEWLREALPSVCRRSLVNWEKALAARGMAAVAGRHGLHRRGCGVIDSTPGMAECIIAEIMEFYEISAGSVMEALEARFEGQPLPTLRSLQRWIQQYRKEEAQAILKMQNPDGWRSKHQAAAGSRSAGIVRINQLWELDSSPTDIILADGRRYALMGCIDVSTRRAILHLARTSSAAGVCSLLRKALRTFGVPEEMKMDNGADYTSVQVTTAVHDLGIRPNWCTPFTPEEKPHIERFFKAFQHGYCVRLPGFVGHSVADRKAIESRRSFAERLARKKGEHPAQEFRYTPEEFQEICDAWCRDVYAEKRHSALGMSPADAAERAEGAARFVTDERALDMLLLPLAGNEGIRTVTKKGIRAGGLYNAPQLGGLEGQQVRVRHDEDDAGYIYVFGLDDIFLCRAEDPLLTGISQREMALARKAHQKAVIGEKVREAKRIVREQKPYDTAQLILEQKGRVAAANRAARAAKARSAYTTPALDEAARAARCDEAPASALTAAEREAAQARAREIMAKKPTSWKIPASDPERYAECLRLMGAEVAGVDLPFEAINWMRAWQNSRTFKAFEATRLGGERAKANKN